MGAGNQEIPGIGCILIMAAILAGLICLSGCAIIANEVSGIFQ
jgi:hypothetical protein